MQANMKNMWLNAMIWSLYRTDGQLRATVEVIDSEWQRIREEIWRCLEVYVILYKTIQQEINGTKDS